MSDTMQTPAERHFFNVEMVTDFGIHQRCALCPHLNSEICQQTISEAHTGEPDLTTASRNHLAELRNQQRAEIQAVAEGCGGFEALPEAEVDAFLKRWRSVEHEHAIEDDAVVIGYRCSSTGLSSFAISHANGWNSLISLQPDEAKTSIKIL